MGPQSDAHTFHHGGRPFDGSFRPLSHIRGAGPFRDGYPAVLPGHILLRSAADLSGTHGGPGTQRSLSWCSVRMWNLIGEMGAVLSPGISGALRDATGSWNTAVMLDAGVILASAVVLLFVKESRAATAGQPSEVQETN